MRCSRAVDLPGATALDLAGRDRRARPSRHEAGRDARVTHAPPPVFVTALQRLIALVPTLLGMTLVMFLIANMLPGDPARAAAGGADATVEMVEAARRQYGLDRPLVYRYGLYLARLARGDL